MNSIHSYASDSILFSLASLQCQSSSRVHSVVRLPSTISLNWELEICQYGRRGLIRANTSKTQFIHNSFSKIPRDFLISFVYSVIQPHDFNSIWEFPSKIWYLTSQLYHHTWWYFNTQSFLDILHHWNSYTFSKNIQDSDQVTSAFLFRRPTQGVQTEGWSGPVWSVPHTSFDASSSSSSTF